MAVVGTDLVAIERSGTLYKATAADIAALAGGGGGGTVLPSSEWTEMVLATDFVISTTVPAEVSGLSFIPTAGKQYVVEAILMIQTNVTTGGARPGFRFPAQGVVDGWATGVASVSATTSVTAHATAVNNGALLVQSTGHLTIDEPYPAQMSAVFTTDSNLIGSFSVIFGTEALSNTGTLKAGSILRYRSLLSQGTSRYPITVGNTPPTAPAVGDLWVDTN